MVNQDVKYYLNEDYVKDIICLLSYLFYVWKRSLAFSWRESREDYTDACSTH